MTIKKSYTAKKALTVNRVVELVNDGQIDALPCLEFLGNRSVLIGQDTLQDANVAMSAHACALGTKRVLVIYNISLTKWEWRIGSIVNGDIVWCAPTQIAQSVTTMEPVCSVGFDDNNALFMYSFFYNSYYNTYVIGVHFDPVTGQMSTSTTLDTSSTTPVSQFSLVRLDSNGNAIRIIGLSNALYYKFYSMNLSTGAITFNPSSTNNILLSGTFQNSNAYLIEAKQTGTRVLVVAEDISTNAALIAFVFTIDNYNTVVTIGAKTNIYKTADGGASDSGILASVALFSDDKTNAVVFCGRRLDSTHSYVMYLPITYGTGTTITPGTANKYMDLNSGDETVYSAHISASKMWLLSTQSNNPHELAIRMLSYDGSVLIELSSDIVYSDYEVVRSILSQKLCSLDSLGYLILFRTQWLYDGGPNYETYGYAMFISQNGGSPIGIAIDQSNVVLKGKVTLSGLTAGCNYYYDRNTGVITTNPKDKYLGYAISSTQLYIPEFLCK